MKFLKTIWFKLFPKKPIDPELLLNRVSPYDIQVYDIITVEWDSFRDRIGRMRCLANDRLTKKLLLQSETVDKDGNEKKSKHIFKYSASEFGNFNLLNQHLVKNLEIVESYEDTDLMGLQQRLNKALEDEEYELAEKLQGKVNQLLYKTK